jgi:hypothetical protein
MTGQLVATYSAINTINVSEFAAGMHMLQVKTNKATYQSRFIKE